MSNLNAGTGVSYNSSSDYRLKEKVKTLPNGLDRVNQMKPVEFVWKKAKIKSDKSELVKGTLIEMPFLSRSKTFKNFFTRPHIERLFLVSLIRHYGDNEKMIFEEIPNKIKKKYENSINKLTNTEPCVFHAAGNAFLHQVWKIIHGRM